MGKKEHFNIEIEDELIKKISYKAQVEGIPFEDYLIKTLKDAVNRRHWVKERWADNS